MTDVFSERHIGTDSVAQLSMLDAVGYDTVEALMDAAVPSGIRVAPADTGIPAAATERFEELPLRLPLREDQDERIRRRLGVEVQLEPGETMATLVQVESANLQAPRQDRPGRADGLKNLHRPGLDAQGP